MSIITVSIGNPKAKHRFAISGWSLELLITFLSREKYFQSVPVQSHPPPQP